MKELAFLIVLFPIAYLVGWLNKKLGLNEPEQSTLTPEEAEQRLKEIARISAEKKEQNS